MILNNRDGKLKVNVIANFGLRGANIVINLALVPLLLSYLGAEKYGVWLTIFSLVGWIGMFDLGLGNGLKIKLTEAFSKNRPYEIRESISSTYIIVGVITSVLTLLFLLSNLFINWEIFLGLTKTINLNIRIAINIIMVSFFAILLLKLVGVIYASLQFPFVNTLIKVIGQFGFLYVVYVLIRLKQEASLIRVSISSVAPLMMLYLGFNIYFFFIKRPFLCPKITLFSKRTSKAIILPGMSFFIIQISMVILYSSDNLIITNLISPTAVTGYNIAFKYFSMPFIFYTLYISTHWPAFIDALAKNDRKWLRNKIKVFNYYYLVLVIGYITFYFLYGTIVPLWVGNNEGQPIKELNIAMVVYFLISSYTTIYIYVINAYGKIRIQMLAYIIIAIINIPLSIFIVSYFEVGSAGVIIASACCLTLLLVLLPIQYFKLVTNKATGIWEK